MKKLLLLPLLCMAFMAKAQLPVPRGPDGVTVEDQRLYAMKNFRIPVFSDTTAANVAKGIDSVGTVISIRGTDTVYIRTTSTGTIRKWSIIAPRGAGSSVTASNGIQLVGADVQLGGTLTKRDTLDATANAAYGVYLTGINTTSTGLLAVSTTGSSGTAIKASATTGNAVYGLSSGAAGVGILGESQSGLSAFKGTGTGNAAGITVNTTEGIAGSFQTQAASTNDIDTLLRLTRLTTGTAADGIGGSIQFRNNTVGGFTQLSNTLVSKFTTAANSTRTSQFVISGVNSGTEADKFTLSGSGALQLNGYSSLATQNDTTTYKPMGMDASGNIKKMQGWAGSGGGGGTQGIDDVLARQQEFTADRKISAGGHNLTVDSAVSITIYSGMDYLAGTGASVQWSDSVLTLQATSVSNFSQITMYPNNGINFTPPDGTGSAADVWTNTGGGFGHWAAPSGTTDSSVFATKHYVDSLNAIIDSIPLRTPGTGTGAIPLAFVNAGSLVIPKIAPGTNISFSVAGGDSLVTINSVENGLGRDTVQAYTSGTTLTQSASTNYIQLNPTTVQATLTITTLGSAGTWHTSNDLYIVAGGTLTAGAPALTTLVITAGSGMTLIQAVTPTTINAGEVIHYHKIGTFLYRIN